jgi:hypothetical protein
LRTVSASEVPSAFGVWARFLCGTGGPVALKKAESTVRDLLQNRTTMDAGSESGDAGAVEGSARYCRADGYRSGAYRRGRRRRDDLFRGPCAAGLADMAGGLGCDGEAPATEHDEDGDGCAPRG